MTDDERRQLRPGDWVRVRGDDGRESGYEVRMAPWQLGHGEMVIGLKGVSGGYLLLRVVAKRLSDEEITKIVDYVTEDDSVHYVPHWNGAVWGETGDGKVGHTRQSGYLSGMYTEHAED